MQKASQIYSTVTTRSLETCNKPIFIREYHEKPGAITASIFFTYEIGTSGGEHHGKPVNVQVHPADDSRLPDTAAGVVLEMGKLTAGKPVLAAVPRAEGGFCFFVVSFPPVDV